MGTFRLKRKEFVAPILGAIASAAPMVMQGVGMVQQQSMANQNAKIAEQQSEDTQALTRSMNKLAEKAATNPNGPGKQLQQANQLIQQNQTLQQKAYTGTGRFLGGLRDFVKPITSTYAAGKKELGQFVSGKARQFGNYIGSEVKNLRGGQRTGKYFGPNTYGGMALDMGSAVGGILKRNPKIMTGAVLGGAGAALTGYALNKIMQADMARSGVTMDMMREGRDAMYQGYGRRQYSEAPSGNAPVKGQLGKSKVPVFSRFRDQKTGVLLPFKDPRSIGQKLGDRFIGHRGGPLGMAMTQFGNYMNYIAPLIGYSKYKKAAMAARDEAMEQRSYAKYSYDWAGWKARANNFGNSVAGKIGMFKGGMNAAGARKFGRTILENAVANGGNTKTAAVSRWIQNNPGYAAFGGALLAGPVLGALAKLGYNAASKGLRKVDKNAYSFQDFQQEAPGQGYSQEYYG